MCIRDRLKAGSKASVTTRLLSVCVPVFATDIVKVICSFTAVKFGVLACLVRFAIIDGVAGLIGTMAEAVSLNCGP